MIIRIVLLCCVLMFNEAAYEGEPCTADDVAGICTLLPKCQSAVEALRKGEGPKHCGFIRETPVVCCSDAVNTTTETTLLLPVTTQKEPSSTPYVPSTPLYEDYDQPGGCKLGLDYMTSIKTGQKALDKCFEYQYKYVYHCAKSGDMKWRDYCQQDTDSILTKVVGEAEFSHEVMLGYKKDNEKSVSWHCGGSIISNKYVLTAAHCIPTRKEEEKYKLIGVLTNSHTNYTSFYEIKRYIIHPEYHPPSKYNDIALLETEKEMALDHLLVPACLHHGNPIVDDRAIATRRGQNGSLAEVTEKVILQKFSTEECSLEYPVHRLLKNSFDPQTQLCYGDRTQATNSCQGYSGGSILIKNRQIYCTYSIIGVSSFGKGCGYPVPPTVYTKVSFYVPWIESIVWP